MPKYIVFFNQQWVGDHSPEWFAQRGVLARKVVEDMRNAGVLVFAAGLDEDLETAFSADPTDGSVRILPGPYRRTSEYLGGLTVMDVADQQAAQHWAGEIARACGWPQEVRLLKE